MSCEGAKCEGVSAPTSRVSLKGFLSQVSGLAGTTSR